MQGIRDDIKRGIKIDRIYRGNKIVLLLMMVGTIICGIWWLVVKNEDQQMKDATRAQQDRWKALDNSWND